MNFGRGAELGVSVCKGIHISGVLSVPAGVVALWRMAASRASSVFLFIFLISLAGGILSHAVSGKLSLNRSAESFIDAHWVWWGVY